MVFTTKRTSMKAKVEIASHKLYIDNAEIYTSSQVTHVGVVRSPEGNGPNILAKLSAPGGTKVASTSFTFPDSKGGLSCCPSNSF